MNNMNNMNDVNGRDNAATRPAILQLPQLCLQGALSCFQQACLLVVGGRAPEVEWLRKASEGRIVWAVDHGLDACLAAGIVPQRLIGDGDSAAPAAWHFAEKKASLSRNSRPRKTTPTHSLHSGLQKKLDSRQPSSPAHSAGASTTRSPP